MADAHPTLEHTPVVDAHLDLAFNAVAVGRDLTLPLDELRSAEGRTRESAMVTWPELRAAGIDLVFGTLFAHPAKRQRMQPEPADRAASDASGDDQAEADERDLPAYVDAEGAHAQAHSQLDWYRAMEAAGWARIVRSVRDLQALRQERAASWQAPVGVVLLMEGADPIRRPDEAQWWWDQGVRIIGPAWQGTRYAGGTRAPGPLTALGVELVDAMQALGFALDVSHLADEALWQVLDRFEGPLLASHSNARALTPSDRHLSDEALMALGERDAVIGLVLGNPFLDPAAGRRGPVNVQQVGRHHRHIAALIGTDRVGVGSDFDGGFGAEETPVELSRGADFARLAEAVPDAQREQFLGAAWWAWLERSLPTS